jgi:hypothetical protein
MSNPLALTTIYNPHPGWYRGELHTHSSASDGYDPPHRLVELAKAAELDFLAITDHNRIDAFARFATPPDTLVIPGIEVTTQNGHFNVYGLQGWYDWMENVCIGMFTIRLAGKYATPTLLMRRMVGQGLVVSINHPLRTPFEWRDYATDLRYVNCVEIWNKPDEPDRLNANPRAIWLWTLWLNAGYRITAIGGSDHHVTEPRPGERIRTERLGWPRNYIYAAELSGVAILDGLRQHRVYVSMGPQVTFQAQAEGQTYDIGADLGVLEGMVEFRANVLDCPMPALAQIIKNGDDVVTVKVKDGQARLGYTDWVKVTEPAWYRLDVYGDDGQMLAITNPIFTGPALAPQHHLFGDFIRDLDLATWY